MAQSSAPEPVDIGDGLAPVRAAIEVITSGMARRVVIHAKDGTQLIVSARALASQAGLLVRTSGSSDSDAFEIVIGPHPTDG